MTSREIITRVIERNDAPRIGYNFVEPHFSDIRVCSLPLQPIAGGKYDNWGYYPELLAKVPGFRGEVRLDGVGNIFGRLDETQGGECIRGVLQDDWDELENFQFSGLDSKRMKYLESQNFKADNRYIVYMPRVSVFSTLRDTRLMVNALMDTVAEPEMVEAFLQKVLKVLLDCADAGYAHGANALWLIDDWGMQHAPFISPASFRELFKPVYKAVADRLHNYGMKLFLHSCGLVWDLIPDFIDAGIDVLQFDQPELSGSENLACTFGKQVTIFSPVDIQRVMPTGDRALIEGTARKMVELFKTHADGAFIARDYGNWSDLGVKPEWAGWARDVFMTEGWND